MKGRANKTKYIFKYFNGITNEWIEDKNDYRSLRDLMNSEGLKFYPTLTYATLEKINCNKTKRWNNYIQIIKIEYKEEKEENIQFTEK